LDGSTQNRQEVIQEFQNPNGPRVLLLSLKAGGVGLTLTRAEHVFLMDPWWNPAVEEQAMDRAHRIGQTKTVQVTRIIAKDTIEEKILELQNKKRSTSQFILDETSQSFKVTKEDLLSLLSH
jgi:SNF2 family DNA or RNA helicase